MQNGLSEFASARPRLVYALVLLLVAVSGALATRIQIDTDPENMLPADQPDRVFHDQVENRFTLHDAIVVGLVNESDPDGIYNPRSLAALHTLSRQILQLEGVIAPDLMSLAESDNISQAEPGTIRFEWMMREAPVTRGQALEVRQRVERLPLLLDTVVSGDGKAAAIYVPVRSKDLSYALSRQIEALTDDLATGDDYHITGLPVAEDTFGHDMFIQMGISAPLAGLMIFLLMLYFFRSWQLVIAPMLVAMATVIISMGLLIGAGFTVHIMSSMIPIFLMPIAVVDSVHIMSEFADRWRAGANARDMINEVMAHLYKPMLFTSLTSAVGFLSLLLTPIPPVQIFGAFVAFGILLAFVLTITLIPAYVVRMKPAALARLHSHRRSQPAGTLLTRGLRRTGEFALGNGKAVIGIAVLLVGVSIAGIFRIQINDNPVRWFKASHPIRIADEVLNRHFAGTYDAFLVLSRQDDKARERFAEQARNLVDSMPESAAIRLRPMIDAGSSDPVAWYGDVIATADDLSFDAEDQGTADALTRLIALAETSQSETMYFQRPDILGRIADLQRALADSGRVGKTNALPDVVKVVNRELRGGATEDYRIPDTQPAVAQTLLQYQSSHRPQDLWHLVTPDYTSAAIWLQLKSGDNQDMTRTMEVVDAWLADHPLPDGVEMRWAGKTYINVVWQNAMVKGMLNSLMGAFAVVLVMMALLFRSVRLGLLAMLPLTVTIVGVYGVIGWIGKDYDMPIAVLSSLTLGLSVDFAIHFIERTRSLLREKDSFPEAMRIMFEEPGRAIARNAIVIAIGFTPLFFAPLVPYITVGAFMATIMALSAVSTLILLPALMAWAGPWLFPASAAKGAFDTPPSTEPVV
jgi:hypothetical protein